jgi:ABC-type ATPase with predicted acetyltransferase domain
LALTFAAVGMTPAAPAIAAADTICVVNILEARPSEVELREPVRIRAVHGNCQDSTFEARYVLRLRGPCVDEELSRGGGFFDSPSSRVRVVARYRPPCVGRFLVSQRVEIRKSREVYEFIAREHFVATEATA